MDLPSANLRFITESDAMEMAMDMNVPIPDPMNPGVFSSLCKFLEKAMLNCIRMDKALSMILAIHKDALDINNFNRYPPKSGNPQQSQHIIITLPKKTLYKMT
jgi:hypothetical protein